MVILNNTTLNNLRTTIRGEFNVAFKNANAVSMYKRLATTIQSSSKTNTYDWLGKFPQMREWVGSRVLKDMSESSYQIANKKYEATLGVDRTDIEDDNLGLYSTIAQSMGQEANDFLDRKVAELLKTDSPPPATTGRISLMRSILSIRTRTEQERQTLSQTFSKRQTPTQELHGSCSP